MAVREERCANSKLETDQLGGKIDALKVVVTKVEGERDELKGLVDMMTRERTALRGRRDDLLREGEGNRVEIVGLGFCLEEADTRQSHLMDEAEASRFDLRAKVGSFIKIPYIYCKDE